MSEFTYLFTAILLIAAITFLTRAFPFVLFGAQRQMPSLVRYLGSVLPCAIMALLVVYCLKDLSGFAGAAQLISVGVVALLQLTKKNMALSITLGTLCYMILIRWLG